MINRFLENILVSRLHKRKALVIIGPRQVGKTTLLKIIEEKYSNPVLFLDCDEPDIRQKLTNVNSEQLKRLVGNYKLVLIDEAQRVDNIGITLKLITDNIKDVQLIVSGSSAIELSGNLNETLTGRKFETILYPFSVGELIENTNELKQNRLLETRLIYGMYPDVINNTGSEKEILKELVNSYLYKDILMFKEVRKPHVLPKLLQLLALQISSEVSILELSRTLEVDKETVERYIDLLEKSFIIFRLSSFSRNLRIEINKGKKIYFVDNGIRNALISNFNELDLRKDKGALWENFLLSERLKRNTLKLHYCNSYFWRTHQQQEIDYIEEYNGKLFCYEFKWNEGRKSYLSKTFINTYPDYEYKVINRENYIDFLV